MKAFLENSGFHFWLKKCCILELMRASFERVEGES
jgi:hypothetical protein